MRRRFARYLGAYCAMVAMLFGQFALAAYVCPAQSSARARPARRMGPCTPTRGRSRAAAMPSSADTPEANACEVHCNDGVTSPGQPDLPPVTLAALPVTTLALAKLARGDGADALGPVAGRAAADAPVLPSADLIPTFA